MRRGLGWVQGNTYSTFSGPLRGEYYIVFIQHNTASPFHHFSSVDACISLSAKNARTRKIEIKQNCATKNQATLLVNRLCSNMDTEKQTVTVVQHGPTDLILGRLYVKPFSHLIHNCRYLYLNIGILILISVIKYRYL